jgi:hypothetical protein
MFTLTFSVLLITGLLFAITFLNLVFLNWKDLGYRKWRFKIGKVAVAEVRRLKLGFQRILSFLALKAVG